MTRKSRDFFLSDSQRVAEKSAVGYCTIQKFVVPLQSVSPKNEKHVDDNLNISSVLAFSEQQDALIAAQQQVTQRVMEVIDASTLYDDICAYFGALPYDKRNFRKYR